MLFRIWEDKEEFIGDLSLDWERFNTYIKKIVQSKSKEEETMVFHHNLFYDPEKEYLNEIINLSRTNRLPLLFGKDRLLNVNQKLNFLTVGIILNLNEYKELDTRDFDMIIHDENIKEIQVFSFFYIDQAEVTSNAFNLRFPYALRNDMTSSFIPLEQNGRNDFTIRNLNDTVALIDKTSEYQRLFFFDSMNILNIKISEEEV